MINTIGSSKNEKNIINIVEGGLDISLVLGDMTQIEADAYVVPHFNGAASFGGVGGAIVRGGALTGMEEYEQIIESERKQNEKGVRNFQEWSKATLTESGGGNSKFLIHVISVGSSAEYEFNVVASCVSNALVEANKKGLETVVFPVLGTGIIGYLTTKQAANAIMNSIFSFQKTQQEKNEKKSLKKITIAIYSDQAAFNDFGDVLNNKSYISTQVEKGEKKLNVSERAEGMKKDGFDTGFIGMNFEDYLNKYTYSVQNLIRDAVADEVLVPGEGIKTLIKITSEKDKLQGELLKVIVDADKRKRKGKNLSKTGTIDGVSYLNPKKYLESAIKKYEEIESDIVGKEIEQYLGEHNPNNITHKRRKEAMLNGDTVEINNLYEDVKIKYQGGFSKDLFDTISLKYYTISEGGNLRGRFKNEYRDVELDKYLEDQLQKQGFNVEDIAQIITSKLYNYYIEEYIHKGIGTNAMKKIIDKAIKNSHEFVEEGNDYVNDINLSKLGNELGKKLDDKLKKNLVLWIFKNKLII